MRLPMAGLFAIEEETGSPAWEVLRELIGGGFRVEHVESVLFHAIRFGSGEDAALDFIERARMGRLPLLRYVGPAVEILAAALSAPERKAGGTAGFGIDAGDRIEIAALEGGQPVEVVAFGARGKSDLGALGLAGRGRPLGIERALAGDSEDAARVRFGLFRRGLDLGRAKAARLLAPDAGPGEIEQCRAA